MDPVPRYARRPKELEGVEAIKAVIYQVHPTQYMYKVIICEDGWVEKLKKKLVQQKAGELYRKWIR